MRKDGLQVVLKVVGAAGINIVAIHQHMTEELPRYMFLHCWSKAALSTSRRASRAPSMHNPVLRINTTAPAHHERNFLTVHYSLASL